MFRTGLAVVSLLLSAAFTAAQPAAWSGYGGDAQHTALSGTASQSLQAVRWSTPVDLNPQYNNGDLFIHYGSATISAANTVIVPVKTGAADGFRVEARSGATGAVVWSATTDYSLPTHNWTPSYSPTLAPNNTLYYAGAGGTLYRRDNVDSAAGATTQLSFFSAGGNAGDLTTYNANKTAYDANVAVSTPITSDANGNLYFGYQVKNSAAVGGLQSGIARISSTGQASFVAATDLAPSGDTTIRSVAMNSAPAVTADGGKVYVTVSTANPDNGGGQSGAGYLVALNTNNLTVAARADLRDVGTPANRATVTNDSTASPMIGRNGDVYMGVLENPFASSKGWLLHFDSNLNNTGKHGAFGWDITGSIVPASMVPSYTGTSTDLIMTKYNNYAGLGGDGVNKLAILDPNDTQIDARTGATVMKEVLTIAGVTPDPEHRDTNHPNAVREWCINTAVVDPATHSVLVNSEDGKLYRWNLVTNTFTEVITLAPPTGEAYTPTLIGPDGTVYAINNATLFAVGTPVPEPTTVLGVVVAALGGAVGVRRRFGRRAEV